MIFNERVNIGTCKNCGKPILLMRCGYVHKWEGTGLIDLRFRLKCKNTSLRATPITKNDIIKDIINDL